MKTKNKEQLKKYCEGIYEVLNVDDPKAKADKVIESGYWYIKADLIASDAKIIHEYGRLNVGICPECGDHIGTESNWPFKWTWNNGPTLFLCKECYDIGQSREEMRSKNRKHGCYIATVCFNSEHNENVIFLKWYRDAILENSTVGRAFIDVYYKISPRIASFLVKQYYLNKLTQLFLRFYIYLLKFTLKK